MIFVLNAFRDRGGFTHIQHAPAEKGPHKRGPHLPENVGLFMPLLSTNLLFTFTLHYSSETSSGPSGHFET